MGPEVDMGVYVILGLAILMKASLFVMCYLLCSVSDSTLALTQDHKNDVLSNSVAVIAATVATSFDNRSVKLRVELLSCWV